MKHVYYYAMLGAINPILYSV